MCGRIYWGLKRRGRRLRSSVTWVADWSPGLRVPGQAVVWLKGVCTRTMVSNPLFGLLDQLGRLQKSDE